MKSYVNHFAGNGSKGESMTNEKTNPMPYRAADAAAMLAAAEAAEAALDVITAQLKFLTILR